MGTVGTVAKRMLVEAVFSILMFCSCGAAGLFGCCNSRGVDLGEYD